MQQELTIQQRSLPWKGAAALAVGLLVLGWLLTTPAGLLGKADAIGYAVCHRIDTRSFHLGTRTLPLCARCSGMYLGAVLGLFFQWIIGRRCAGNPPLKIIVALGAFVVAFFFDGVNSYLSLIPIFPNLYQPNNVLRLFTGTGMGLALAAALFPAFNQTIWKDYDEQPALRGVKDLLILIFLAVLLDLMVLTENPLALYPLALVSVAGVLLLLTTVYTMVWMLLLKAENTCQRISELLLPLLGGFGFAVIQLAMLDLVRYILTGTWDGFHLG